MAQHHFELIDLDVGLRRMQLVVAHVRLLCCLQLAPWLREAETGAMSVFKETTVLLV